MGFTEYVVGFLFYNGNCFAAVRKDRGPEIVRGKINGIGGKLRDGEKPLDCMIREFREETGMEIDDWDLFCSVQGEGWRVWFYRAFRGIGSIGAVKAAALPLQNYSGELLSWQWTDTARIKRPVENLHWLIPMALCDDNGFPFAVLEKAQFEDIAGTRL